MAAPSFVTADYRLAHTPRCEVLEDDGSWARVTVYEHTVNDTVVLWFGGTNYEGIGAGYHWEHGPSPAAAGGARVRTLLDGDGCAVETRPLHAVGSAQLQVASPSTKALAHCTMHTQASPSTKALACTRKHKPYIPFKGALALARSLGLPNQAAWVAWCATSARPANMPSHPDTAYKHDGWHGYGHWLGTGNIRKGTQVYLPFQEALMYARSLALKSQAEWGEWRKSGARPANIPTTPHKVYKHAGWQGYGHWLGTGNVRCKDFLVFKDALDYVRSLHIPTQGAWCIWCKSGARPANIPYSPNRVLSLLRGRLAW